MGSSILVGGISSFLGTLPLAFSTSEIFSTVFIAFLGLVTLGIGHGLILLPIFLYNFGTEDQVRLQKAISNSPVESDTSVDGASSKRSKRSPGRNESPAIHERSVV